jgi:hypothetical protein
MSLQLVLYAFQEVYGELPRSYGLIDVTITGYDVATALTAGIGTAYVSEHEVLNFQEFRTNLQEFGNGPPQLASFVSYLRGIGYFDAADHYSEPDGDDLDEAVSKVVEYIELLAKNNIPLVTYGAKFLHFYVLYNNLPNEEWRGRFDDAISQVYWIDLAALYKASQIQDRYVACPMPNEPLLDYYDRLDRFVATGVQWGLQSIRLKYSTKIKIVPDLQPKNNVRFISSLMKDFYETANLH